MRTVFIFRNVKTFTKENIVEEIVSSTLAECFDETNVDRNSILMDSLRLISIARNQLQYGRPVIEFSARYE